MRVREIKRFNGYCMNMYFDREESVERRFVFFNLTEKIFPVKIRFALFKIKQIYIL